jgi:cathepsin L
LQTGALEGQNQKKYGQLVSLSEQQLVDCTATYGLNGCDGGIQERAFTYIHANGGSSTDGQQSKYGLDTESDYPYTARVSGWLLPNLGCQPGVLLQDGRCRFSVPSARAAPRGGYVDIPQGDEDALKAAVANIGPISVGIHVSQWPFMSYKKGDSIYL